MGRYLELNSDIIHSKVNKIAKELAELLEGINFNEKTLNESNVQYLKDIVEENQEVNKFIIPFIDQLFEDIRNLEQGVKIIEQIDQKIKKQIESGEIKQEKEVPVW